MLLGRAAGARAGAASSVDGPGEPNVGEVSRRDRPTNRYELLTCALEGHVTVGEQARTITPDDALVVREHGGLRWCRCLRCDAWTAVPLPAEPTTERVPARDEIAVPARGPVLRDRYVLRLIALDRAFHVLVLGSLGIAFLLFARHDAALHTYYTNLMSALDGGGPGTGRIRGVLGYLRKAFEYTPSHLYTLAAIVLAYACLEAVEMVGLWRNRRWAEYLTFVATTLLIPYEIYEIVLRLSVFKVVAFVINVAVVAYLLWAKRLFGVRGGYAAEEERRRRLGGWEAIERATPDVEAVVVPVG